MDSIYS